MTEQVRDRIIYKGQTSAVEQVPEGVANPWPEFPLEELWAAQGSSPRFVVPSTANYRGYEATWEISHDRLWLVAIEGQVSTSGGKPVRMIGDNMDRPLPATITKSPPVVLTSAARW